MAKLAPEGPVYQAGTLSGNPLAMAAGKMTLELLAKPNTYERLEKLSSILEEGLSEAVQGATVQRVGSMMTLFFAQAPIRNYAEAKLANREQYGRFFHGLLERGVYFPPSQFEALFVSLAHDERIIAETITAAKAVKAVTD